MYKQVGGKATRRRDIDIDAIGSYCRRRQLS